MNGLDGKVVLVTGSTGIAAAGARRLAAAGAAVFIASRTEEHAESLASAIVAEGGRATALPADLTDEAAVETVATECVARYGRIDGLLSVAGGSGRRFGDGPVHAVTREAWESTLRLNLTSQALVAGAVVSRMLTQEPGPTGRGTIVLVSSVLATHPVPVLFETHAYAAAKGAIVALARSMAAAYAGSGIRVNALAPGLTDTPMASRASADPATVAFAGEKQPLVGGLLTADDVAGAALYLLSDEARAVTGQVLAVDGGWSVTSVSPGAG